MSALRTTTIIYETLFSVILVQCINAIFIWSYWKSRDSINGKNILFSQNAETALAITAIGVIWRSFAKNEGKSMTMCYCNVIIYPPLNVFCLHHVRHGRNTPKKKRKREFFTICLRATSSAHWTIIITVVGKYSYKILNNTQSVKHFFNLKCIQMDCQNEKLIVNSLIHRRVLDVNCALCFVYCI